MKDCNPQDTPLPYKPDEDPNHKVLFNNVVLYQQIIGSLIYLANSTRPDITFSVSYLARYMAAPTLASYNQAKHVLRYLKGTMNLSLQYSKTDQPLVGYSDAEYAGDKADRRSVGGYVFIQSGAAITWRCSKQPIVSQSAMEAELIALTEAGKEALWLRKFQAELFPTIKAPTLINEDNQSAIDFVDNPIHSNRSKHIDVRYLVAREWINNKQISVLHCPGEIQTADIMTKPLQKVLHLRHREAMGLRA